MKKMYLLFLLIVLIFFRETYAIEVSYRLIEAIETDDCYVSFIECDETKFIVKQIKDPSPDEQFLLVLDALGCFIAESAAIPMNIVRIIPANTPFIGKQVLELPATLHSLAKGVSTDKQCLYHDIDVHQRFRKPNSLMWKQWGPLPSEKTGLTLEVIQNMARHPDLPGIVALDTFVGNADRSSPNLFYDEKTDRFCGIDMAASFSSPLALAAYQRLEELKSPLICGELSALKDYADILEFLIENWPPEKQHQILLELSERAGFKNGSSLLDQDVVDRIEFHKKNINDNYQHCIELHKLINRQFYE